ncbi:hypothetical protein [Burkholderia latens]|uniref:hypothetical protein n=1 Tax=Burkholderia latens TaxID=488446 RepID=UPI001AE1B5B9|nr:hypothetical protein [Burkholderia latens]QTO46380.1 hypothetical protein J8I85_18230 [Burkholderia latens]
MIDQDKMRALAAELRKYTGTGCVVDDANAAADAIDLLLAEVEAANQKRKEAVLDAEKAREERNRVHVKLNAEWIEKTNALRAELEAAAADKRDAQRYRWLRDFGKDGVKMTPPVEHIHAMIYSHMVGAIPASRVATGDELDRAIDAAMSVQK